MNGELQPSGSSTGAWLRAALLLIATLHALSCSAPPPGRGAGKAASTNAGATAENANADGANSELLNGRSGENASPDSPIRKVDFENFSYPLPDKPKGGTRIKLRNGEQPPPSFSEHGIPRGIGYGFGDVTYGEITGDQSEEAIVTLHEIHSGTGIPNYVYIYTLRDNRPTLLWSFATGDRAEGGLQKVAAENGELVVELRGRNKIIGTNLYADDGHTGGNCCHDAFTRTRYRWQHGKFRQQGTPEVVFITDTVPRS